MTALPCRLFLASALLAQALHADAAAAPNPATYSFDTTPRAGQHPHHLMDIQSTMTARVAPLPGATDVQLAKPARARSATEKE